MLYAVVRRDEKYVYVRFFGDKEDAISFAGGRGKIVVFGGEKRDGKKRRNDKREIVVNGRSMWENSLSMETGRFLVNLRSMWERTVRRGQEEFPRLLITPEDYWRRTTSNRDETQQQSRRRQISLDDFL